jgi:hypothetical protein
MRKSDQIQALLVSSAVGKTIQSYRWVEEGDSLSEGPFLGEGVTFTFTDGTNLCIYERGNGEVSYTIRGQD